MEPTITSLDEPKEPPVMRRRPVNKPLAARGPGRPVTRLVPRRMRR